MFHFAVLYQINTDIFSVFIDIIFYSNPNITGSFSRAYQTRGLCADGAFDNDGDSFYQETEVNYNAPALTFSAKRSNGIYGNSSTVQPPVYQTLMIIKV